MKSLTAVWTVLAQDMGEVCSTSTSRDQKTVRDRVEQEGLSFLTIALPSFAKSLEQALDRGSICPTDFAGFKRSRGLPCFLRGFLDLVFDQKGVLLLEPDVDAIRAIRQLCLVLSKIELECAAGRTRRAYARYVECEKDLRQHEFPDNRDLNKVFLVLYGGLMGRVSALLEREALTPRHGPGATADRLQANRKWTQGEWPRRLERSFPMDAYLLPNHRHWQALSRVKVLEPGAERPVRVITVPKTMKTPRIIAIEPTCMQYAQQALLAAIRAEVNGDTLLRNLIGMDDQRPNRDLARLGSSSAAVATLDLSEASDRVSNQLVYDLTRPFTPFARALQDSRSKRADVPGHGIIPLAKFASMGSAVCFPVEAMVFSAIAVMGVVQQRALPLTSPSIRRVAREVRVFGDDIIVPTDCAARVADLLSDYGMEVNRSKSFWTGRFRESCGGDYYDGVDVSVHRLRQAVPTTRGDSRGVAALFSFRNQCYMSGYWKTAAWVDNLLGSFRIPLPRVASTSPVLGRLSFLGYQVDRMDEHLQAPRVRGLKVVSRPPCSSLHGVGALMKVLVTHRNEPLYENHLERSGRPRSVYTKTGWGSPF